MYIQRKGNGMMGLGGAEACGPNQMWSPDYVYNGIKGQCLSVEQFKAWEAQKAAGGGSGGGWFDSLVKGATDVLKARVTPAPVTNITSAPGSGMSTTTKVAIAGGVLLAAGLIWKSRK